MPTPTPPPTPDPGHDDSVGRLIRLAAELPPVPDEVLDRARDSARAAWRDTLVARRRQRTVWIAGGLAASLLIAILAVRELWPAADLGPRMVTLAAIAGSPPATDTRQLDLADRLIAGDRVVTTDGRVALALPDGTSLRLDKDTSIRLTAFERRGRRLALDLDHGAIYVDSPRGDGNSSVRVTTPLGQLWDVGTQFEARLDADAGRLRVRVREGRVEIVDAPGGGRATVAATTEQDRLTGAEWVVDRDGDRQRREIAVHGTAWRGYLDVVPPPDLDGATIGEVLAWVGRETGWSVVWSDPNLERRRRQTVLRGDFAGVPVDQIPAVVLPTCGLSGRVDAGTLFIDAMAHNPEEAR